MSTQEDLKTLVDSMPESIENLENALASIDTTDEEIDKQITAIRDGLCENVKTEFDNYLTLEKLPYIQETVNPTAWLVYDANFGEIGYGNQLDGWSIHAMVEQEQPPPTVPPDPPAEYVPPVDEIIYSPSVNWDSDSFIEGWMSDWAEGNDYLTRPLTSGATYGLMPYKDTLANASNILNENKSKLESSYETFSKYVV